MLNLGARGASVPRAERKRERERERETALLAGETRPRSVLYKERGYT